jgi:hypothetical protein
MRKTQPAAAPTSLRISNDLLDHADYVASLLSKRQPWLDEGGPSRHEVLLLAVERGLIALKGEHDAWVSRRERLAAAVRDDIELLAKLGRRAEAFEEYIKGGEPLDDEEV